MLSIFCMALNPRLSSKQFEKLAEQVVDSKQKLMEKMLENAGRLETPEQKIYYIQKMLPFILMWGTHDPNPMADHPVSVVFKYYSGNAGDGEGV